MVRQAGANDSMYDDGNTSMAGLTDMSMGEIKRLDESAAYGGDSMA